jgi:hypothetical protein
VSYSILRTDGTLLTTIPDGVINTTSTPLGLPGRNFASYGQVVDTNFVHQLENFADNVVPSNSIRGQLWYDTASPPVGSTGVLKICPSDGESNSANWYTVLTPQSISNLTLVNLTATANITANNANITNDAIANAISANYLTVNVNANIANANITGITFANTVNTRVITTGTRSVLGNITGAWTVNGQGTVNGVAVTSLWVTGGNLVITDPSGVTGIRTDNYMYANGAAVDFDGSYTNSNVAAFLPTYVGNVGEVGNPTIFNGRTLTTGSNTTTGELTGNWTLSAGSKINGLSGISAANIVGAVANATYADTTGQALTAATVTTNAQPNITSVGTLTSLAVTGNVTAGNVYANSGTIGASLLAGTLSTAAQPNITSIGTLTGLTISGNATFAGQTISLGSNSNVNITSISCTSRSNFTISNGCRKS